MSGERRALSCAVAAALTRRQFLAAAGAAAALPLSAIAAAPPAAGAGERLDDWTIDDMWGVFPRYADPIGYAPPHEEPVVAANAVDAAFIAV